MDPWLVSLLVILMIQLVLTILSQYMRPDFLNLTICALGLFMVTNPQNVDRKTFRFLIVGIVLSWIYDAFWIFWVADRT